MSLILDSFYSKDLFIGFYMSQFTYDRDFRIKCIHIVFLVEMKNKIKMEKSMTFDI